MSAQLTLFDGEIAPASDYCQRWTDRLPKWRHTSEGGFDRRRYDVAPIDEALARDYVVQHHYSASYPAARLRFGLFDSSWYGRLVGVAVLSVPVQRAVLTKVLPDLEPYAESLELGRLVLSDRVPANAESWFLARVFDLAARDGLRGVVSFSDPVARRNAMGARVFVGHVGTIYQASNATYTGRGTARTLYVLPDGTVLNDRALQKVRGQEQGAEYVERRLVEYGAPVRRSCEQPTRWLARVLPTVAHRQVHRGNHRYVFTLGRERHRVRVAQPSLPYPKQVDDET